MKAATLFSMATVKSCW
jgi:hypothetical protein